MMMNNNNLRLCFSLLIFVVVSCVPSVVGFVITTTSNNNPALVTTTRNTKQQQLFMADTMKPSSTSQGDAKSSSSDDDDSKSKSMAKYLVNLHDSKETFDFCGGMMFQLVLTDALRDYLIQLSTDDDNKDIIVYENTPRMYNTPTYKQSSDVDNIQYFHGREIRNVPNASGGMGMVLQLSLANANDPEGWTIEEQQRYDGWGHDSGREWRKGTQLIDEGYKTFQDQFGSTAFSLHHRFYFHRDIFQNLWLAAEDGCQGTPKQTKNISNLFGLLK